MLILEVTHRGDRPSDPALQRSGRVGYGTGGMGPALPLSFQKFRPGPRLSQVASLGSTSDLYP